MPPTPPTTARGGARALLLVALPLLLGFATGALLAADLPREVPPAASVKRADTPETDAARVERQLRRARARVAPSAAARAVEGPTRRSVQQAVDGIDPRAWLAGYGSVTETPLETPPPADSILH
jgi:hypothetical protein